ncbi:anti-sigma factor [Joostella atrarenae]|uniref:Anti-sigma factor n=1 Tax=Joostella atrarenae TaxID=679257 RepID=A0ABS9J3C4_9FLAO|nr:anti-sigma factor [Joostella atrarenae]MCF8714936.1 anti-sigma factor [Joostella atrarenae]
MKKIIRNGLAALLVGSLLFVSCSDDDDNNGVDVDTLTLNIDGLEDLGADYMYEGWIIVNGSPVSTGVFSVNADGELSQTDFAIEESILDAATTFVLSIEPTNDSDPAPADTKILVGDFSNDSASLTTGIVGDFSGATGSFFLRTPTDETGTNNGNDENGIWFGIPGAPPAAGLDLPTLPAGWVYEGWVVAEEGPLSTGTFTEFDAVDSGNPFSGTEANAGPPVPGEDFFLNAPDGFTFPLDVRGKTVVISVEPSPDNSPAPFTLKPLAGAAGTETAPTTHDLGLNLGSLPTGSVTR